MTTLATRILAVDPGVQYLGVAVFEGEELLWFGVKTFSAPKSLDEHRCRIQNFLSGLVETYHPSVFVIEQPFYAQALLSDALGKLTSALKTWARWKGLRVISYTPPEVKAFFCRDQRTKQSLAEAMVAYFPFLARYLSPLPWRRRYWFHVFDAVGLGLMCQRKLAR
jgi:Holliday junction resolvasome RuvABC endonuclease subunit